MTRDDEPTFHGIDMLGTVAAVLFGQVESTVEQLETMREVEHRRMFHVLDDETLDRMSTLYTAVLEDADLYAEKLRRWKATDLMAKTMIADPPLSTGAVAQQLGAHRSTVYRCFRDEEKAG